MSSNEVSVVLVHGAWADGSSWAKIIVPFGGRWRQGDGGAAAADVVPRRCGCARSNPRGCGRVSRLAGHAYAGAVIAATRSEKVKALVYVSALAPDEGETVADVFYRGEPHPQAPKLAPDAYGLIHLQEAAFAAAFAQNASTEELAVLAAVQRPISSASGLCGRTGRPGIWRRSKTA
jgi:hypothetical protein